MLRYSLVIPAYNAEKTIAEALASAMRQSVPPSEIIVIDDGSTDATAQVASGASDLVRVISKQNGGPGSATTVGFKAAQADYIAGLDADDLWLPYKMERQLKWLQDHPDHQAVFCKGVCFTERDGAGKQLGRVFNNFTRSALLMRRASILAVGDVKDFEFGVGDMVDWLGRSKELGYRHGLVDEVLVQRRIHPKSMSYGRDENRDRGLLHVARLALERKKRATENND